MLLNQYLHRGFTTLAVLLFLAVAALSAGSRAHAQPADPWQLVNGSARGVLETLDELRDLQPAEGVVNDAMVARLMEALEPVVDFDTIAVTVMGRHANAASDGQIENFTREFRNTMVRLYLQSFLNFGIAEVTVASAPPDFNPANGRASVEMRATDSNRNNFRIRYSMRTDAGGEWRVRNIIVEGVNLGLTYLNQFDSAMNRHGDLDLVIQNWRNEVESVEVSTND